MHVHNAMITQVSVQYGEVFHEYEQAFCMSLKVSENTSMGVKCRYHLHDEYIKSALDIYQNSEHLEVHTVTLPYLGKLEHSIHSVQYGKRVNACVMWKYSKIIH